MGTYIARRLLWVPVLLLITTFVTFALGRFGPGDPVEILLGQHFSEEVAQRIRAVQGLDDDIATQYVRYLGNVLQGDFGESYQYRGRSVTELLKNRIWVSAQLNFAAFIIAMSIGIPAGLFAALRQGSWWDSATVSLALVGQSMHLFLTIPIALYIFSLRLGWLPSHGWDGFFSTTTIMPAFLLGIPAVAGLARLTRASTLDCIGQDYIRTARAKGLPERLVRVRHILRNSLIPVATTLGFSLAGLFGGSLVIELYFGIPGVGRLTVESLFARDYPIIMAVTLLATTMFVLANLVVDLIYPVLDPRIRLGGDYIAG